MDDFKLTPAVEWLESKFTGYPGQFSTYTKQAMVTIKDDDCNCDQGMQCKINWPFALSTTIDQEMFNESYQYRLACASEDSDQLRWLGV